jgi:hypothetical protein
MHHERRRRTVQAIHSVHALMPEGCVGSMAATRTYTVEPGEVAFASSGSVVTCRRHVGAEPSARLRLTLVSARRICVARGEAAA